MIGTCPRCGYSLSGLPSEHTCPECAFEYELDAIVIQEQRRSWKSIAVANGGTVVLGAALWVWIGSALVLVFATAGFIIELWRYRRPRRMVAVSRSGIRMIGRDGEEQVLPSGDVGHVEWRLTTGQILIYRPDGSLLYTIESSFLRSSRQTKRLLSAIREFKWGNADL